MLAFRSTSRNLPQRLACRSLKYAVPCRFIGDYAVKPPGNNFRWSNPYEAERKKWTPDALEGIGVDDLAALKTDRYDRKSQYKNIRTHPPLDQLLEKDKEDNPFGTARKYVDIAEEHALKPFPRDEYRPDASPNLISSIPLEHEGTCKRVEMHKPETLNALDIKFAADIRRGLQFFDDGPNPLTFIWHTSTPGTMFCPGTDLRAILDAGRGSRYVSDVYAGIYNIASVVHTLKKMAFIVCDGPVFGSGAAFLAGQFRTTTVSTVFAVPDVLVGFFPDAGIVHKLSRLDEVGRYIALTGRRLNYADLHDLGIANYHIDNGTLVAGVQQGLGLLAHDDMYRRMTLASLVSIEPPKNAVGTLKPVMHLINRVFKKKTVQLMMAELEKIYYEPENAHNGEGAREWAARTYRRMGRASPVSLRVTLEYLDMASRENFNFYDCLSMDYRLSQRFADTDDYWRGLQAACDRNRSATWSYKDVSEVDTETVRKFFVPFEDPRKEFKPVYSRPNETPTDWKYYYNKYLEDFTVKMPDPDIVTEDGGILMSRHRATYWQMTYDDILNIPCYKEMQAAIPRWVFVCQALHHAIIHPPHTGLMELAKRFANEIAQEAFGMVKLYFLQKANLPQPYVTAGHSFMNSVQLITRSVSLSDADPMTWLPAAVDVLPVITRNAMLLEALLIPAQHKTPEYHRELRRIGIEFYNRGLVDDVDYVSH